MAPGWTMKTYVKETVMRKNEGTETYGQAMDAGKVTKVENLNMEEAKKEQVDRIVGSLDQEEKEVCAMDNGH